MSEQKIKPGQQAPDFSLFDSDKKKVSLADYRGRSILLLFFPMAFTSTCTKELCSTRDNIALYDQANAQVLGISVDSVYTLARYKEEQRLNFPLLSDFNKEVSAAYGALYEVFNYEMKGVSKRAAFVIGGTGIVEYAEILENAGNLPDFNAIHACLSRIN